MPRELGDRDLHAEADAEIRDPALARDAAGGDLPLPAAGPEAAGHEHAVDVLELGGCLLEAHALGVEPAHVDADAVVDARVLERLVDGEVRVVELHVLADEGDLDLAAALRRSASASSSHSPSSGSTSGRPSLLHDERVEPLLAQRLGHEVDVADVLVGDHGPGVDVGEERDLLADVARERGPWSGR